MMVTPSETKPYKLMTGNALQLLRSMDDESVQTIVTSPPYFNLRAYGTDSQVWDDRDGCAHEWASDSANGSFCTTCSAWRGELGLEPSVDLFVKHLVEIFREARRVLRRDGTVFLNIGDTYNSYPANRGESHRANDIPEDARPAVETGFGLLSKKAKNKDLLLVPSRLALALQEDGWWVRQDVIWSKAGGNCPRCYHRIEKGSTKPESAKDRFVRAHEYVFLLTKSQKYFFDTEAVKEPFSTSLRRSVLHISSQSFRGVHYATMPLKLAEVGVLGGTSAHGACAKCHAPYARVTKKGEPDREKQIASGSDEDGEYHGSAMKDYEDHGAEDPSALKRRILAGMREVVTLGWKQTCQCEPADPVPCVVMDPFSGAATTGVAAISNGRHYIGLELLDSNNTQIATPRLEAAVLERRKPSPTVMLPTSSGIYQGKAEILLQHVVPGSVRLVLTDPPYNVSRPNNFHTMGRTGIDFAWDGGFDQETWIRLVDPAIMPGGSIVVWNDWKAISVVAFLLKDMGYDVKGDITWKKVNPWPRNRDRTSVQVVERGLWAVKPGGKWVFNRREHMPYEGLFFEYPVPRAKADQARHPTMKPMEMFRDLIEILSDPGDLVLDPFAGSGTTGVAAELLGRRHIQFEELDEWYNVAVERWEEASSVNVSMDA